jgi:Flp pilus assembly protein TadD
MATSALSPAQMNELGRSVITSGDLDQAAEIFALLVDAEIAEASAVLALGFALHTAGRTKDALEWTGRAVSLAPEDPL